MQRLKRAAAFLGRTDGSLHQRALRSSVWVALSSAGVVAFTFGRGIVLARLLEPEVFGLMAVCLMATRFIEILTETGFTAALIHRQGHFEDARDTAFSLMVIRGLGLSLLALAIAPGMAAFYDQPVLGPLIAFTGLGFVLTGCQNINTIALQKDLNLKRLTHLDLTGAALGFAIAVGLAYWLRTVWALAFAQVASAAVSATLSYLMVPGRPRFRFNPAIARDLYKYGRFMTGLAIVVFLTRELDNALIGKLLGMEMLGFYVVAYSLATIPTDYLSRFVSRVLFPMFSKLQTDLPSLRTEHARGIGLIAAIMVPLTVTIVVLAPEIIRALYGDRWTRAAAPLQVLAVFACFRALWLLNGYLFNAIGKPHIDFYMNLGRLLAMLVLLFPLTQTFGLTGAAAAVAIPMALQFAIGLHLSRRYIGSPYSATVGPLMGAVGQGLVLGVVLLLAKLVITSDPRLGLAVLMMLSGLVFLALNMRAIRTLLSAYATR